MRFEIQHGLGSVGALRSQMKLLLIAPLGAEWSATVQRMVCGKKCG